MRKHNKERDEVNRRWAEVEPAELDTLRADMGKKTQTRMGNRLQSRWVQVMLDRGVVKLDEWGDLIMCDPAEYRKWQRAESMIAKADQNEEDRLFRDHPELEAEAKARFRKFLQETREAVWGVSKAMNITSQET